MRHPSSEKKEVRVETATKYVNSIVGKAPLFDVMHHMDPLEVEECTQVLKKKERMEKQKKKEENSNIILFQILSCDMLYIPLMLASPAYRVVYYEQSQARLTDAFAFHKSMMQLFEFQNPSVCLCFFFNHFFRHVLIVSNYYYRLLKAGRLNLLGISGACKKSGRSIRMPSSSGFTGIFIVIYNLLLLLKLN